MKKRLNALIGCTNAHKDIANSIQQILSDSFSIHIWFQEPFLLGISNINNLISSGKEFDFVILILTPDSPMLLEGKKIFTPSSNIILEIGFFISLLGTERTFLICEKKANLKLPSYLNGIVTARYARPRRININSVFGPICTLIKKTVGNFPSTNFGPSFKTPNDTWTTNLVLSALKVVCNALEAPLVNLDAAKLRAFIFQIQGSKLVCTHFWALRTTREAVNVLKFPINNKTSEQVAVVKAAIKKKVVATKVKPLKGIDVNIDPNLCYVLAAPIIGQNGEIWGTVDIDASSDDGEKLLNKPRAKEVLFELGKHLYLALTRQENLKNNHAS